MNVRDVIVNMELWVRQSSPNFARLRQSSYEGVRMLLVRPRTWPKRDHGNHVSPVFCARWLCFFVRRAKSAINLNNLGIFFAKFGPGPFIYVRPVGGPPEKYLC